MPNLVGVGRNFKVDIVEGVGRNLQWMADLTVLKTEEVRS